MPNSKNDTPIKKPPSLNSHSNNGITLADVMKKLNSIENSHNDKFKFINDKLTNYESKITVLSNSLNGIMTAIGNLRDENQNLKKEINSLHNKIENLESTSNTNNSLSSDEVIYEAQNRLIKSKNVIVFNIAELPGETEATSLSIANNMLSDLALNINITQAKRIGKACPDGRPLLLEFNNTADSRSLLKCKSKLRSFDKWRNIWVNADLTQYQQSQMKSLRDILRKKRADGDSNSFIKYVNGMPTIYSKN